MRKMTEAQRTILERMANGEEVWTLSGVYPSAFFWHGRSTDRAPSIASVCRLRELGFIAEYKKDWKGGQYRITPAGRRALEQGRK